MTTHDGFTCYIIGEGALAIQCGEILLRKNKRILGVKPGDNSFKKWAVENKIPINEDTTSFKTALKAQTFDYLFSIVNYSIIPSEILKLPQRYAINYHDSLLPKYAGLNATSWAIMNQEKKHGVSWHLMLEGIDNGDILKQAEVEITKQETAYSLNLKCFETAINLFDELIDNLTNHQETRTLQDTESRSYYSRYKSPSHGWIVSWDSTAEEIEAESRALDFEKAPNPLGLQKLFMGEELIIVKKVGVSETSSGNAPGTIVAINETSLKVTTISKDILFMDFYSIYGEPLSVPSLVFKFKLKNGYKFIDAKSIYRKRIDAFDKNVARNENFWIKRFSELKPIQFPYPTHTTKYDKKKYKKINVYLNQVRPINKVLLDQDHSDTILLTAFLAYLSRVADSDCFDIGFSDLELRRELGDLDKCFETCIPLKINFDDSLKFQEFDEYIQNTVDKITKRNTFCKDLFLRYPSLSSVFKTGYSNAFEINIEKVDNLDYTSSCSCNILSFLYDSSNLAYALVFNTDVLESETVTKIAGHINNFLKCVLQNQETVLQIVPFLFNNERRFLLKDINRTEKSYPAELCVHQCFEKQVVSTPDDVAIFFQDESISYYDLNQRANKLAYYLLKKGAKPDQVIGLCLPRSIEMVIGLLGIMKAGSAYLPLDPMFPIKRLSYMLDDADCQLLITESSQIVSLPNYTGEVILIDDEWPSINKLSTDNPTTTVESSNLIYLIYTSGSTGKPKGVQLEHKGVVNFLYSMQQFPGLSSADVLLSVTTLSFDISVLEIFLPILTGAKLVLVDKTTSMNGNALIEEIEHRGVSVMQATPATWRMMIDAGWKGRSNFKILCGGEAFPEDLVNQLLKKGNSLWNLYGPTETTIWSTVKKIENAESKITIGRPINNTQTYILDTKLQLVPRGAIGELHIGGDGVARGYLNRKDLTAERFISNPFKTSSTSRIYKTGDYARILDNGDIECLGRMDSQVKIRGFRIELGEIEQALLINSNISESVVVARNDMPGGAQLIAYLVSHGNKSSSVELRTQLEQHLPEYMVPNYFVWVDSFPLTANGKLDRLSLPIPDISSLVEDTYRKPEGDLQQNIAKIWQEVLEVDKVGVDHNFFELGGHSILMAKVHDRLKQYLQSELSIIDLFRYPTISSITNFLNKDKSSKREFDKLHERVKKQKQSIFRNRRFAK